MPTIADYHRQPPMYARVAKRGVTSGFSFIESYARSRKMDQMRLLIDPTLMAVASKTGRSNNSGGVFVSLRLFVSQL